MGFGFNLGFIFIILPLCAIFFLLWITTRKPIFGKALAGIIAGMFALVISSSIIQALTSNELAKKDYYGSYIIDRNFYPGQQADWQYNNFRFEIKENDSIYFYHTDKEHILTTYKGVISTVKPYNSERVVLKIEQPPHHIIKDSPTTYRRTNDFYLVFNSEKFSNVFFTKGKWEPLVN